MPVSGGGSRGGGGGFGGSFGGGNRGGGFGGGGFGHHHHHHGYHYSPFFFWRRPYYGYGGGCLGGLFGIIMLPVIVVMLVLALAVGFVGDAFTNIKNGGSVNYDFEKMSDYCYEEYADLFGASEDCILIVFVTNETSDKYEHESLMGTNLPTSTQNKWKSNYTGVMSNKIDALYKNSLFSDLTMVIKTMKDILLTSGNYPIDTEGRVDGVDSAFVNKTELKMSEDSIKTALEEFTEETGIPLAVVVDDAEDVFGITSIAKDVIVLIIFFGLIILAIILIIRAIKNKKNNGGGQGGADPYDNYNRNYNGRSSGYNGGGYYR